MEIVKKFGLWVAAAVIAIGAIVVFFLFVQPVANQVSEKRAEIGTRRDDLKKWAQKKPGSIPNPRMIELARQKADQVSAILDQCEAYLGRQPRLAETRRFFTNGPTGPEIQVPLDQPFAWLTLYQQHNQELRDELAYAGMSYTVQTRDAAWGSSPPKPEQIAGAMDLYWFQKDLIDFLTDQVERDFAAYLASMAQGKENAFPATPYDLVVNRSPARLDEFLRATSREKLAAVLSAIVVNRQQQDLAMIFNTLLPDERKPDGTIIYGFPWERPSADKEHGSVRGFTMDEEQEKFLADMLPPGKPDLSDRQRFLDHVMELRMVRYRADVIGLLESHHVEGRDHFDSLAISLRRGTEAELDGILRDIADVNGVWNPAAIAEAISAIVSINNENDYQLVRNNHSPNVAALVSLTVDVPQPGETIESAPVGPRGSRFGQPPPAATPGQGDLYQLRTFDMQVKLEFTRIPVFLRRLESNSWRYRIQIADIAPAQLEPGSGEVGAPLPAMLPFANPYSRYPSGRLLPARSPAGRMRASANQPSEPETVEAGNYVILRVTGDGYQFTPLLTQNRATPAGSSPAPAGRPGAAPTGAR